MVPTPTVGTNSGTNRIESGDKKNVFDFVFFSGLFFLSKSDEKPFFSPNLNGFGVFYGFHGFYGLQNDFGGEKKTENSQNSSIFQIFHLFVRFLSKTRSPNPLE